MNGVNLNHELTARAIHQEDMNRAAERRQVREAKQAGRGIGMIWKLFSRLALSDHGTLESAADPNPRAAA